VRIGVTGKNETKKFQCCRFDDLSNGASVRCSDSHRQDGSIELLEESPWLTGSNSTTTDLIQKVCNSPFQNSH
jgi:hypothetical protein